jgi:hypothetical protein
MDSVAQEGKEKEKEEVEWFKCREQGHHVNRCSNVEGKNTAIMWEVLATCLTMFFH